MKLNYPKELKNGVNPLIYVVNAIPTNESEAESKYDDLFEEFMEVIEGVSSSSNNLDEEDNSELSNQLMKVGSNASMSNASDSKANSEAALSAILGDTGSSTNSNSNHQSHNDDSKTIVSTSSAASFINAYASQNFFQCARFVSVSRKHAFPPSKDPMGHNNIISQWVRSRNTSGASAGNTNLSDALDAIDGILPSGWLEKHVHALPSLVLVVTYLEMENENGDEIEKLVETIESLRSSLASKRECRVHLICFYDKKDNEATTLMDQNMIITSIRTQCHISPSHISVLSTNDLNATSISPSFKRLHKTIREASLTYYLAQARRVKRKYTSLTTFCSSIPEGETYFHLAVRYCFKTAIFYEFQLKTDKSTKYFMEAYRLIENYFISLIVMEDEEDDDEEEDEGLNDSDELPDDYGNVPDVLPAVGNANNAGNKDTSPSVEVTLAKQNNNAPTRDADGVQSTTKESDMPYQCRTLADWINYKLLHYYISSSSVSLESTSSHDNASNEFLSSAVNQWRRYTQVFLFPKKKLPMWYFWKFVSHSRYMLATLLKESFSKTSVNIINPEINAICNVWRLYMSAGEGFLRLNKEIDSFIESDEATPSEAITSSNDHRSRYVGALDSIGFKSMIEDEQKLDYLDVAKECILQAISLAIIPIYKSKSNQETIYSPPLSKLYFLSGQIYFKQENYKEACQHFLTAFKYNTLAEISSKILKGCIKIWNLMSPSDALPFILEFRYVLLESDIKKSLPDADLNDVKKHFFYNDLVSSALEYNVYFATLDRIQKQPISYTWTFTHTKTHSTSGDIVASVISLKSNMDFDVCVKSLDLYSSLEKDIIAVDKSSLEKSEFWRSDWNGVLIKPGQVVFIDFEVLVPFFSLKQNNAGRYIKPKTSGLTRSAGTCYLQHDSRPEFSLRNTMSSTSLSLLGGTPWYCTGIHCFMEVSPFSTSIKEKYPPYTAKTLKIEYDSQRDEELYKRSTKALSSSTTRSTIVADEESYVIASWSRPLHHPLSLGPRCLRILPPIPLSNVVDITAEVTDGNLIEGVVNRVVLKLTAGEGEYCKNIQFRVLCKHSLAEGFMIDGNTVSNSSATNATATLSDSGNIDYDPSGKYDSDGGESSSSDLHGSSVSVGSAVTGLSRRNPMLVVQDVNDNTVTKVKSYTLPQGWKQACDSIPSNSSNIQEQEDDYTQSIPDLKPAQSTYASFELFRSLPIHPLQPSKDKDNNKTLNLAGCKTDYEVVFTYHQIRNHDAENESEDNEVDEELTNNIVTLYYRGSYQWINPLSAQYSVIVKGPHKSFPCGSRHNSNLIDNKRGLGSRSMSMESDLSFSSFSDDMNSSYRMQEEISVNDGESIRVRCNLLPTTMNKSLAIYIESVSFEKEFHHEDNICNLTFIPAIANEEEKKHEDSYNNTIFKASKADPETRSPSGPVLYSGSNFSLSYLIQTHMKESLYDDTNIFKDDRTPLQALVSLGIISINWKPISIPLKALPNNKMVTFETHGPLPSTSSISSCIIKFLGPQIRVEYAPFKAKLTRFPFSSPKISCPFIVAYSITNKTPLHQRLSINMSELPSSSGKNSDASGNNPTSPSTVLEKVKSDGILLSGLIHGEITLHPHETKEFDYCILAIRAGRIALPTLKVVSLRYRSWVIHDAANPRFIYILP